MPSSEKGPNGSARSSRDGSAPLLDAPVARVRKFVERYGRVFGTAATPEPVQPRSDGVARTVPSNPELQAMVAAQAGSDSAGRDRDPVDGFVILDDSSAPPAEPSPEPARPASDDIVFID
jgi:hypothetical protein